MSLSCYLRFILHNFLLADAAPEVVEKPGDNSLSRLKMLYEKAKELAESEVKYAHLYLSQN